MKTLIVGWACPELQRMVKEAQEREVEALREEMYHDVSLTQPSMEEFAAMVKTFDVPTMQDLDASKHRLARQSRALARARKKRRRKKRR